MPNTGKQTSEISTLLAAFSADAVTSAANGRTDRAKELERIVGRVLNVVLDAKLIDQNRSGPTFPAIDLGDPAAKIAVQVTIRSDREKVKDALNDFLQNGMEKIFDRLIVMMFVPKVSFRGEILPDEKYADRRFAFHARDDVWDLARLEREIEWLEEEKIDRIWQYLTEQSTVFYPREVAKTPTHRLPPVPAPSSSFVPGSRDRELEDLKNMLSPDAPVFLYGVGGIGKTEVAIQLARNFALPEGAYFLHYYDTQEEALRETILRANFTDYTYNKPDNDHRDQEYKERMDILSKEYPGALLVIDNFDCTGKAIAQLQAEPAYRELTALGIQLVFTTRSRVKNGYEIPPLDETYLLTLIRENLDGMEVSDDQLRQLIEAVGGHTLMTVLMARTLAESWGDVTPETILDALRNSDLNRADFPEVVSDQNQSYEQRKIYAHMRALFDLSRLKENEAECAVLRCATLLPEDGMEDKLFKSCVPQQQHQPLRNLANRGLLRHEGDWLTIHPVIREVCRTELEPTDGNCGEFLDRLWNRYSLSKEFYADKFTQIARCFSMASDKLEDKQGEFALRAGRFWDKLGQAQTALRYELRMVERREKDPATKPEDLATAYNNVGITYGALGDHSKALEYKLKALAISEKVLPPEHPDLATTYNNVGTTYGALGDHQKALEYKLKAMKIHEKVLPPTHPHLATSYNNVGITYGALGDHSKALEYLLKALEIKEKVLPPEHPSLATSYNNVGSTYGDLGEHSKALEYQLKDLAISEKVLPPEHPDLATSYSNISATYGNLGDHEKELEYDLKALAIREKVLPPAHPDLATSYNNIGITYANLKQFSRAVEYLEKALVIMKKSLPATHPSIAETEQDLEAIRFMAMLQEAGISLDDLMKGNGT